MNRNILVTIVVVILIAAAGGYYFMNQRDVSPASPESMEPVVSPTSGMEKTTLKDFMSMAGSQQCTFFDAETGNSGNVFVGGGKMRGDFSSEVAGKVTPSYMVNDGTDIYIWMDDQATGFKTSLTAIEEMSKMDGMTGVNQTVDINKEVEYKCEDWTVDPVKFAVPVEVRFQDMGAMMQNMQGMMQSAAPNASGAVSGGNAAACAACENLEGDQKTQCLTALKC